MGGGGATALHIDAPGTSHPLGLPGRTPVRTALTLAHGSDAGCRSEPWGRLRLRAGSPLPGGPSVLSIKNHLQLMGEAPTPRGMAVSLKVRQVHVTHTRKHRAGRPRPYVAGRRRVAGQADRNPGYRDGRAHGRHRHLRCSVSDGQMHDSPHDGSDTPERPPCHVASRSIPARGGHRHGSPTCGVDPATETSPLRVSLRRTHVAPGAPPALRRVCRRPAPCPPGDVLG